MITVTAGQRAQIARLRINHPRAKVTLPSRQRHRPIVRVRMYWPPVGQDHRWVCIWIHPDGRREMREPE